jgi:hypothetical protein
MGITSVAGPIGPQHEDGPAVADLKVAPDPWRRPDVAAPHERRDLLGRQRIAETETADLPPPAVDGGEGGIWEGHQDQFRFRSHPQIDGEQRHRIAGPQRIQFIARVPARQPVGEKDGEGFRDFAATRIGVKPPPDRRFIGDGLRVARMARPARQGILRLAPDDIRLRMVAGSRERAQRFDPGTAEIEAQVIEVEAANGRPARRRSRAAPSRH